MKVRRLLDEKGWSVEIRGMRLPLMVLMLAALLVAPSGPQPAAPFTTEAPRLPAAGQLRVLVLHDMEGLAGQDDWRTFDFDYPEQYRKGQELLVGDVNAVISGLFDGGATKVEVVDGHGSGNQEPDIRRDLLDRRATQVLRDAPFRQYVDLVRPDVYDAVVLVGMHAKTGSGGFASHTFTLGMDFIVNGLSITESELVAFSWARAGVPVILVSGDDKLRADLAPTMPWIEFVTVKTATSASTAVLRPLAEARADLRSGAKRAVERLRSANGGGHKAMKLREPVQAALRVVPPASLSLLRNVPGINLADDRVTFEAKDYQAAYDGLVALTNVASRSYPAVLTEMIAARPDGAQTLVDFNTALTTRWLDVESGRYPARPVPVPAPPRKYHGAR